MKELQNITPDKTEQSVVVPATTQKIFKKIFKYPGHRYFELELSSSKITEVFPEVSIAKIVPEIDLRTGRVVGTTTQKTGELRKRDGCLYCSALNPKNADKEFHRMLGIVYKKPKIKK